MSKIKRRQARTVQGSAGRLRRNRRRNRLRLLLLALTLFLLVRRCDEAPEQIHGDPTVVEEVPAPSPVPPPVPAPVKKVRVRTRRKPRPPVRLPKRHHPPRPTYQPPTPLDAPRWLPALQLQVSARAPQLAGCLRGSEAPGLIRWRALLDLERGLPSAQSLESISGAQISESLRRCLFKALSAPTYRLDQVSADERSIPAKISMILEF
ncbi:MAG: hypothetical protein VYD19_02695 [Myxococcota bacterium]|nr:hypothetical protein [Myxococcota bacterium]